MQSKLTDCSNLTTLATIYVPLSFAASLLGMNVKQFNKGSPVSLWAYFAIALPLTMISLLAIRHYGSIGVIRLYGYIGVMRLYGSISVMFFWIYDTLDLYLIHHRGGLWTIVQSLMDSHIVHKIRLWAAHHE